MLIPAMLYGTYPEVRKRVRKAVNQILKGESLASVLETDKMLDTSNTPGIIYLEPPMKHFEKGENFHAFPVGDLVRDPYFDKKYSDEREEQLYQELLMTSWGILTLTPRPNAQLWLRPKNRYPSFLKAALGFLSEFNAIGDRFETTSDIPRSFWEYPHGLFYALANLGVPTEEIHQIQEERKIPPLETLIPN
jgi:hypothetical protein